VHLGYGTSIWLSLSKLPLKCAAVSLYSVVKKRLKCNTGKVCICLIQFLLTMVLRMVVRVFLVEYVFREGNIFTDLVLAVPYSTRIVSVGSSKICGVS
jgi:hypothetical protein